MDKSQLDKRICDYEPESNNTQTYREFMTESEDTFDMLEVNLDNMTDAELDDYFGFLDSLWNK